LKNKFVQVIIVANLSLLSYFLLTVPPSTMYEPSVYVAYPWIFWVIYVLTIVLSQTEILITNNKKIIIISSIIICILTLILLSLPLIRGYLLYGRFDPLVHIGRTVDILNTGHIDNENFYPIMHILLSEAILTSNISISSITIFFPSAFLLLFGFWYVIFGRLLMNPKEIRYLLPVVFLPLFGRFTTTLMTSMLSFFMIPLILWVWFKNDLSIGKKSILLLFFIVNMIYFHILTAIYLVVIFILSDIATYLSRDKYSMGSYFTKSKFLTIPIVSAIFWIVSFKLLTRKLLLFIQSLLSGGYLNPFVKLYLSYYNKYQLSLLYLFKISFFVYGTLGILTLLSIKKILEVLLVIREKNFYRVSFLDMFSALGVVTFIIWMVITLFARFIEFNRVMKYIILFLLLYFPRITGDIVSKMGEIKLSTRRLFIFIILLLDITSIFSAHPSPLIGYPNFQVLESEYTGIKWFFENKIPTIKGYEQGIPQYSFYASIYGYSKLVETNIRHWRYHQIPDHYGYGTHSSVGEIYSENVYFIISEVGKVYLQYLLPKDKRHWRWNKDDLKRLRQDKSANWIYSNKGFEVYIVI